MMMMNNHINDYELDCLVEKYNTRIAQGRTLCSSFDFETTGLNPYKEAQAFSIAICYPNMEKVIIDFKQTTSGGYTKDKKGWRKVQDYFDDTSLEKVAHNLLFEMMFLKRHGITIPKDTILHDSMIAHQMLRNDHPSHALDYLAWEYGSWSRELDKKVKAIGTKIGYHNVSKELMHPYQLADVERCLSMFNIFYKSLIQNKRMHKDYLNEILLLNTTERMQSTGIGLCDYSAKQLLIHLETWLEETQEQVKTKYGSYYNLNSTSPLHYLLFKKLKLPILEYTKTGKAKVDKNVLLRYKNKYVDDNKIDPEKYELLDLILKTRSYIKGIANIKSYIGFASKSGILHPSIRSNNAKTGRATSDNPNGQNIQKSKNANVPFPIPARSIFYPPIGYTYYLVDYAGIEMRLIVEAVQEQEMMDILNYGDGDLHAPVASLFFDSRYDNEKNKDIKKSIRSKAKNVNFAVPYGAGFDKVFVMLSPFVSTMLESKEKLKLYKKRFPKVYNFSTFFAEQVKRKGFVITSFGRILYVNRIDAYMAGNYRTQGTAAGLLKRAENRLHRYTLDCWDGQIRLVIPIHDELIIQVPNYLVQYEGVFLHEMSEIMTQGYNEIKVKLDVEWKKTSTSWADAQDIDYTKMIKRNNNPYPFLYNNKGDSFHEITKQIQIAA